MSEQQAAELLTLLRQIAADLACLRRKLERQADAAAMPFEFDMSPNDISALRRELGELRQETYETAIRSIASSKAKDPLDPAFPIPIEPDGKQPALGPCLDASCTGPCTLQSERQLAHSDLSPQAAILDKPKSTREADPLE